MTVKTTRPHSRFGNFAGGKPSAANNQATAAF